jgi:hypothetical protein
LAASIGGRVGSWSDPALYYADRVAKPRKQAQRRDPRRRAETTLAAPLPAVVGAPAHEVGALVVLSLEATVAGVGRFTFSAPIAAQLLLTAACQRAKDADILRIRVFRKLRMGPSPRGVAPSLREPDVFPFLQAAMAAVILGYTALEAFTTETLPVDFSIPDPRLVRTSRATPLREEGWSCVSRPSWPALPVVPI